MLENNVSSLKKISIEAVQKQNLKYKTGSTSTKCFHAHKYRNKARPQVTRVMQPTQRQVAPYATQPMRAATSAPVIAHKQV